MACIEPVDQSFPVSISRSLSIFSAIISTAPTPVPSSYSAAIKSPQQAPSSLTSLLQLALSALSATLSHLILSTPTLAPSCRSLLEGTLSHLSADPVLCSPSEQAGLIAPLETDFFDPLLRSIFDGGEQMSSCSQGSSSSHHLTHQAILLFLQSIPTQTQTPILLIAFFQSLLSHLSTLLLPPSASSSYPPAHSSSPSPVIQFPSLNDPSASIAPDAPFQPPLHQLMSTLTLLQITTSTAYLLPPSFFSPSALPRSSILFGSQSERTEAARLQPGAFARIAHARRALTRETWGEEVEEAVVELCKVVWWCEGVATYEEN
jgi:hypothetical protein